MIKHFMYHPEDRNLYEKEIKDFLPERIFDFHIHLWRKEQILHPSDKMKASSFLDFETIDDFSVDYCLEILNELFPGKIFEGLFFGDPFKEIDLDAANKMIKDEVIKRGYQGLYIVKPDLDSNLLKQIIIEGNFKGLKPYPELCIYKDYSDQDSVSIFDYLTHEHLKVADELGLIVILHIPKTRRMNDEQNVRNITEICKSYPGVNLVLAHAGRSFEVGHIADSIHKIAPLKNLYVDIAMLTNSDVFKILLEYLGSERILYGSDLPVAAIRGKNVSINAKHYFATDKPYKWSITDPNIINKKFSFFIYEEILEMKKAIFQSDSNDHKRMIDNIFYNNALKLIQN